MRVYHWKKRRNKIIFAILALSISVGSYFIVSLKSKAEERLQAERQAQEERESKKIEKLVFGYSTKGRPIDGYEIGDGSKTLMFMASIHGSEKGSAYLMDQL